MELPPRGEIVTLEKIQEICNYFHLNDLWKKIHADPPVHPFKSDGCSLSINMWKGVCLYPACFLHDLKYWAGYPGQVLARFMADVELMLQVAYLTRSTCLAVIMFLGVRVGGHEIFKLPFSWSFGRQE